MDEFKKPIHGLDPMIAFCVGAGLAVLGFIFFLVLNVYSVTQGAAVKLFGSSMLGVGAPFPLFLMLLYCLLAPLAFVAIGYIKKEFPFWLAACLFIFTLFVATYFGSAPGLGIGSILNLIIYCLLSVFAYLRKGAPVEIVVVQANKVVNKIEYKKEEKIESKDETNV